jgi:hypothetical protein
MSGEELEIPEVSDSEAEEAEAEFNRILVRPEPLHVPGRNRPLGAPTGMQGQRQTSVQSRVETPYVPPVDEEAVKEGLKRKRDVEIYDRWLEQKEIERAGNIGLAYGVPYRMKSGNLHHPTVEDYRAAHPRTWPDRSEKKLKYWAGERRIAQLLDEPGRITKRMTAMVGRNLTPEQIWSMRMSDPALNQNLAFLEKMRRREEISRREIRKEFRKWNKRHNQK